jgi:hypothetical protein
METRGVRENFEWEILPGKGKMKILVLAPRSDYRVQGGFRTVSHADYWDTIELKERNDDARADIVAEGEYDPSNLPTVKRPTHYNARALNDWEKEALTQAKHYVDLRERQFEDYAATGAVSDPPVIVADVVDAVTISPGNFDPLESGRVDGPIVMLQAQDIPEDALTRGAVACVVDPSGVDYVPVDVTYVERSGDGPGKVAATFKPCSLCSVSAPTGKWRPCVCQGPCAKVRGIQPALRGGDDMLATTVSYRALPYWIRQAMFNSNAPSVWVLEQARKLNDIRREGSTIDAKQRHDLRELRRANPGRPPYEPERKPTVRRRAGTMVYGEGKREPLRDKAGKLTRGPFRAHQVHDACDKPMYVVMAPSDMWEHTDESPLPEMAAKVWLDCKEQAAIADMAGGKASRVLHYHRTTVAKKIPAVAGEFSARQLQKRPSTCCAQVSARDAFPGATLNWSASAVHPIVVVGVASVLNHREVAPAWFVRDGAPVTARTVSLTVADDNRLHAGGTGENALHVRCLKCPTCDTGPRDKGPFAHVKMCECHDAAWLPHYGRYGRGSTLPYDAALLPFDALPSTVRDAICSWRNPQERGTAEEAAQGLVPPFDPTRIRYFEPELRIWCHRKGVHRAAPGATIYGTQVLTSWMHYVDSDIQSWSDEAFVDTFVDPVSDEHSDEEFYAQGN